MSEKRGVRRVIAYTALALAVAEVVLMLLSWLLSATAAGAVRSLLSAEGIRFFFGHFASFLQGAPLVWLLLLAMAWGCLRQSGLLEHGKTDTGGLRMVLAVLVLVVAVVLLLTLLPHAVLLSATGGLWPSPFSRALVPIVAFAVVLLSAAYGFATRRFTSPIQVFHALSAGVADAAPLFVLYVLLMQFIETLRFVF